MDEVLAVGDAQFQKKCLGKMEDVSTREGRTVLFVSHNLAAIKALCSRVLLLKQGELIADEETAGGVAKYVGEIRDNALLREWRDEDRAPQNSAVAIVMARMTDVAGNLLEAIYCHNEFKVEITYKMKAIDAFAGMTFNPALIPTTI